MGACFFLWPREGLTACVPPEGVVKVIGTVSGGLPGVERPKNRERDLVSEELLLLVMIGFLGLVVLVAFCEAESKGG